MRCACVIIILGYFQYNDFTSDKGRYVDERLTTSIKVLCPSVNLKILKRDAGFRLNIL
ncbi:hypothetical protein MHA01_27240 [Marinococcus halophilus]|uniref:Uncharacterized protein n=1 Tax=Marinococcus halophilus TaxID=1371 RepID=A0A510Y8Z6_MARHA|nr:hypothetical protein MHA01_27240 [Marinococcus halophilus]